MSDARPQDYTEGDQPDDFGKAGGPEVKHNRMWDVMDEEQKRQRQDGPAGFREDEINHHDGGVRDPEGAPQSRPVK